jgi:hypothetical protein
MQQPGRLEGWCRCWRWNARVFPARNTSHSRCPIVGDAKRTFLEDGDEEQPR